MRLFVCVSEIPSGNRSHKQQVAGEWVGSGAIRISVAHLSKRCTYLLRVDRQHAQIVELPASLVQHEMFAGLGSCSHCWREESIFRASPWCKDGKIV